MDGIVIKVVVNALAIWAATVFVPGVTVGSDSLSSKIISFAVLGALFGIVNAFIKPVVKLFAFPFYLLTLGLFAFVVNALMLKLVEFLSGRLGIEFDAGPFFFSTLAAALVVWVVSMALSLVVSD